ncbi:MAG: phage integrase N-terminal SAM-like domain-containing protein [Synechococcales bacterium]|nr:phage integrase N-terminal SAM-like domain-containing protein [Synechococcales bacterium]
MSSLEMGSPGDLPKPKKLLYQVRDVLRTKHYAYRTEQSYVDWIRRFILFHNKRHPQEMREAEVEAFLNHLAVEGRVSASTQNQALSAIGLRFLRVGGVDSAWEQEKLEARKMPENAAESHTSGARFVSLLLSLRT